MKHYDSAPRTMRAKYAGKCAETGKTFQAGEFILYYAADRKAYCTDSKTYQDWATAEMDRVWLNVEY